MLDRSGTPRYEFWYPYHFILNGWQEAELRPFVWLGCGEQTPPDQTSPDQISRGGSLGGGSSGRVPRGRTLVYPPGGSWVGVRLW